MTRKTTSEPTDDREILRPTFSEIIFRNYLFILFIWIKVYYLGGRIEF